MSKVDSQSVKSKTKKSQEKRSQTKKSKPKTCQKQPEQPPKPVYRVKNWAEYNESLKHRGSLTFWFDEQVIKAWEYQGIRKRGGKIVYSDLAIQTGLVFRKLFRLGLRQTEGFVASLVSLLKVSLPVPDYTTFCRRNKTLKVDLPTRKRDEPLYVVVDSTGLKVFGEGAWKVRQHGYSKRRTWRKLHLAVDEKTGEILSAKVTKNSKSDAQQVEPLLEDIKRKITTLAADSAYDTWGVYDTLQEPPNQEEAIQPIIPPQHNAVIKEEKQANIPPLPRDEAIRTINRIGLKKWKEESGYHRRSLAETAMARYKRIIGGTLAARTLKRQKVEAKIGCMILNVFGAWVTLDTVKVDTRHTPCIDNSAGR